MKRFILVLLAAVFQAMLKVASPLIRKAISDFLDDLAEKAATTDNKFDDAVVAFLQELLAVTDE